MQTVSLLNSVKRAPLPSIFLQCPSQNYLFMSLLLFQGDEPLNCTILRGKLRRKLQNYYRFHFRGKKTTRKNISNRVGYDLIICYLCDCDIPARSAWKQLHCLGRQINFNEEKKYILSLKISVPHIQKKKKTFLKARVSKTSRLAAWWKDNNAKWAMGRMRHPNFKHTNARRAKRRQGHPHWDNTP